jgi:hypothetical protein
VADSGTGGPVRFRDLYAAYIACRRGKRQARNTMAYEARCLDHLIETRDALNDHTWRPSRTLAFVVNKPKAREIHAADFGDRVVHHWLVPRLEAWFEPVFIHDSYSNRKGKGTHAAVDRLQDFVRQATRNGKVKAHYLQLDIANFFNSIDREILYGLIRHRAEKAWQTEKRIAAKAAPTRDEEFAGGALAPVAEQRHAEINFCLWLCRTLLGHDAGAHAVERGPAWSFAKLPAHKRLKNAPDGIGLPIGNLTSQFFANVYLDRLDQFIKHELKCRHYLRYVDDFVLVHEDPAQLLVWRDATETFLAETLALRFKALSEPRPVGSGIDFLGYVVRRTYRLPRRRVLRQAQARLAGFAAELVHPLAVVADGIAGKPAPANPFPPSPVGAGLPAIGSAFGAEALPAAGGWAIRWEPNVRERLRASWASTLGHLSQAASRRQALALWRLHPWAHSAFAFDACRFRLVNRFEPTSVASYTGQKRWFARRFQTCVLLVQKGWEYELVDAAGQIAGKPSPAIPVSHLPRIVAALRRAGRAYVIVREEGYLKRGLKRRVLSEIGGTASWASLAAGPTI